jgi:hypothetical protein
VADLGDALARGQVIVYVLPVTLGAWSNGNEMCCTSRTVSVAAAQLVTVLLRVSGIMAVLTDGRAVSFTVAHSLSEDAAADAEMAATHGTATSAAVNANLLKGVLARMLAVLLGTGG